MGPMHLLKGLLLGVVASGLRRSSKKKADGASLVETAGKAQQLWDAYVRDVQSTYASYGGIQKGCEPRMHANRGSYRGSIVLFHGFTACPQQFEHLIPRLTQAGYRVFSPLNPGHGMVQNEWGDQFGEMPTNKAHIAEFGDRMHAIMMATEGERHLFGLSLGGAIASYVGKMGGFDRRFVAVPFITMKGLLDTVLKEVAEIPGLRKVPVGWGDACEVERQGCRAGVCNFNSDIAGAARDFGLEHLADIHSSDEASSGQLQMVFVENDGAVSSESVREVANKFGLGSNSKYLCGLDEAIGHSFLSPYDSPDQNKYWMAEVEQMVVNFLTKGTPVPQGGGTLEGSQRCAVKCTPQSCPYDSVAQSCASASLVETAGKAGGVKCPGSPSWIHASCKVEARAMAPCASVAAEINARVAGQYELWHDPHNNGTYTMTKSEGSDLHLMRLTGDGKYTDKMVLTLAASQAGETCTISGCSESQGFSVKDFSTNYCNLRMLYCGTAEGCKPLLHDFPVTEAWARPSPGATASEDDCIKV